MRIKYRDYGQFVVELSRFKGTSRINIKNEMTRMRLEMDRELELVKDKNPETVQGARAFYEYVCGRLDAHGDETLYRVFAHGDFHLFNLFKTDAGMKLIDWEGVGEQSLLYDFFNYFFSHLWVERTKDDLAEEVMQAIEDMAARLERGNSELAASLREKRELYLMMFYLERIHALATVFRSSPKSFQVWLNVYRNFEENWRRLLPEQPRAVVGAG